MKIRFFSPEQTGTNKLADFLVALDAPWGHQTCRGMVIWSDRDRKHRALWPRAGERFATSGETREDTERAEVMILERFEEWYKLRGRG